MQGAREKDEDKECAFRHIQGLNVLLEADLCTTPYCTAFTLRLLSDTAQPIIIQNP